MSVDERLQAIFSNLFNDNTLELSDEMTSNDIDGWDSLAHVNLMFAVEQEFDVEFADEEFSGFSTVGALKNELKKKLEE